MWFRKSSAPTEPVAFPGEQQALNGQAAAFAVESVASDALVVESGGGFVEITGPLQNLVPHGDPEKRHQTDLRNVPGLLVGLAATGLRTAAFVNQLAGIQEALAAIAGKRLATVISLTAKAQRRQSGALHGSHDDYYGAANAGFFQLFARNVQEVADFTLIAHRVAELSLTPGICAQDFYRTNQSVQNVLLPERELIWTYLGQAGDAIAVPTPAQHIIFGEQRRRIPRFIDPDHPAGIGGIQDQDSFFRAVAAQRPFFAEHLGALVDQAMSEFGELTGRSYENVAAYRADDADVLVLAQGAVVEELGAVVDYLREKEHVRAGLLNLTLLRPFPGAALTHKLKGKQAVTVLERADAQLAEDPPLLKELRGAIDKAVEIGSAGKDAPGYPGYDRYSSVADRPQVYSGIYGIGTDVPSFDDLVSVYRNMLSDGKRARRFYVGVNFAPVGRRFPHLQRLQQRLNQAYPRLAELSLPAARLAERERACGVIRLHALAAQGGIFAGNLFARALSEALRTNVRTFPEGGLEPTLQPVDLTLAYGPGDTRSKPATADTILVSGDNLIRSLVPEQIRKGGAVIVTSSDDPDSLWRGLSRRTEQWIREREIRLYVLDAGRIAADTASQPSFIDQLTVWVLFGASMYTAGFADETAEKCRDRLRELITTLFGTGDPLIDEIAAAFARGGQEAVEVTWQEWPAIERTPSTEREPPWTTQQLGKGQQTLFDRARFWHSVGYLYDSGQADETLTDPFLATGVMPAASSAHSDMTPYRLRLPEWLPENCTGCGLCWAHCPDSALPPTIQDLQALVDTAVAECKDEGATMTQMGRIATHLVKQAYRLVAKDDLHQYRTIGPLLADAFTQLAEKMGLEGETLTAMSEDLERVAGKLEHWPFARTENFFDLVHKAEKGSGRLLSIAVNPSSCKACGLCIDVCPEGAFAWTEQTNERLERDRRNWTVQMKLPAVPAEVLARHLSSSDASTQVNRLLDRTVYHSLVGGDNAFPGNSAKTAVHLVTGAVESVMQDRFKAHEARLTDLVARLMAKIQGKVADVVRINDFEDFSVSLSRLEGRDLTPDTLASIFGGRDVPRQADQVQLARSTRLLAELEAQRRHYAEGRARLVLALDQGDVTLWSGNWPDNPHASPWVSHTGGDAPALATGVFEGISQRLARELACCRLAELELEDRYEEAVHGSWRENLGWQDLTSAERQLMPSILVVGQAGITKWEDVAGLLAGPYPIRVVILDTEGVAVSDSGETETNYAMLAFGHGESYVLQTTVGHPGHLIQGITASLATEQPALIRIHTPDPNLNGIAPEKIAEQSQRAYLSRAVPLFEYAPGMDGATLTVKDNPDPLDDWSTQELQIREPSGSESSRLTPLTVADWAVHEARFRQHFRIIAKGHVSDEMKPLAEFLSLDAAHRVNLKPYITVTDDQDREFISTVSPAMAVATERCLGVWTHLQQLAGGERTAPQAKPAAATPEQPAVSPPPAAAIPAPDAHRELTEKLLALCGYSNNPEFFRQSLRDFLQGTGESTSTTDGDEPSNQTH